MPPFMLNQVMPRASHSRAAKRSATGALLPDRDEGLKTELGGAVIGRVDVARELFLRHCPKVQRFLDIGCGAGVIGRYLGRSLNAEAIYGLDVSERLASVARKQGCLAAVANLDASHLPFKDESMDAIFCGEVIEHLIDPDHLLDEIGRALKPEGVCVITTPNLASWINRIMLALGWTPLQVETTRRSIRGRPRWAFPTEKDPAGHIHVMTVPALKAVVRDNAFVILESIPYGLKDNMPPEERFLGSRWRQAILGGVLLIDQLLTKKETLATGILLALRKKHFAPSDLKSKARRGPAD
jgi:SAM-dependent methyltransferase